MKLTILYRGPLSSCNYRCGYCPFAKHTATVSEQQADDRALQRFVEWAAGRTSDQIAIFFTPWGEALIRERYQQALIQLTNLPQVTKAAIQTNLSCLLDWVEDCDKTRMALWTTYHPSQITREQFLARCAALDRRGVRYSVGMVGLSEYVDEMQAMRRLLPEQVYLWVNAFKRIPDYYPETTFRRIQSIDPLFPINAQNHPSLGHACRCGESVIAVYGDGTAQRCHFIKEPIGNIYEPGFEKALYARPCKAETCGCHIGYVHMDDLKLYDVFGNGILERIPRRPIWRAEEREISHFPQRGISPCEDC